MPIYRLYYLSGSRLVRCEQIEASHDQEAERKAEEVFDGSALELWSGDRKIRSFEPIDQ
jgi:hypothetical protein